MGTQPRKPAPALWLAFLAALLAAAPARPEPAGQPARTTVTIGGTVHTPLPALADRFGMGIETGEKPGTAVLRSRWTRIEFEAGSREIRYNGLRIFLGQPAVQGGGSLCISRADAEKLIAPILKPGVDQTLLPKLDVIVLDAGHGGNDSGALNDALGLKEKTLTLEVVRQLKAVLEDAGFRVVLTRGGDRYTALADRAAAANSAAADLFVSIHFNAIASSSVSGIETYTLTPAGQHSTGDTRRIGPTDGVPGNRCDHWNAVLGHRIHQQLIGDLAAADRGLKRARFKVLTTLNCPGVLVECGYLSNPAEARRLSDPRYIKDIVAAISEGIQAYGEALSRARGG